MCRCIYVCMHVGDTELKISVSAKSPEPHDKSHEAQHHGAHGCTHVQVDCKTLSGWFASLIFPNIGMTVDYSIADNQDFNDIVALILLQHWFELRMICSKKAQYLTLRKSKAEHIVTELILLPSLSLLMSAVATHINTDLDILYNNELSLCIPLWICALSFQIRYDRASIRGRSTWGRSHKKLRSSLQQFSLQAKSRQSWKGVPLCQAVPLCWKSFENIISWTLLELLLPLLSCQTDPLW